jgi:hypothetical protein
LFTYRKGEVNFWGCKSGLLHYACLHMLHIGSCRCIVVRLYIYTWKSPQS